MYATHVRFNIIAKVHGHTFIIVALLAFVYGLEQGIIVPLYVIKAQPIPMVSDMLKSALKKLAVYGCFLLKIIIFVALNIK